jgi:hypothetical protein
VPRFYYRPGPVCMACIHQLGNSSAAGIIIILGPGACALQRQHQPCILSFTIPGNCQSKWPQRSIQFSKSTIPVWPRTSMHLLSRHMCAPKHATTISAAECLSRVPVQSVSAGCLYRASFFGQYRLSIPQPPVPTLLVVSSSYTTLMPHEATMSQCHFQTRVPSSDTRSPCLLL